MTTYVWAGGSTGAWNDAGNWTPSGGPPEPGDTAQVYVPAVIGGDGAAAELDTSNASGQVTLNGVFNIGTIFNGAEMTLAGNITSQFLETFVNLDITGDVSVLGDTDATYEGIFQYNGTVDIDNGGSVAASYYLLSYNGGSLDQPNVNAFTLDGSNGGAWLDIVSTPTVNESNQIVGGFAVTTSASVAVQNGATLTTPYLSLGNANAIMTVSSADIVVPSLADQDDDDAPITDTGSAVAGVSIDGGILMLENSSTLSSPYFSQAGNAASQFVLDDSTATFDGDPNGLNGFALYDGSATWRDNASISASQIYVGEPIDPGDTLGPSLSVLSSTIVITGTQDVAGYSFAGLWLADGQTDITNNSTVFTPGLEVDGPDTLVTPSGPGTYVEILGGSTVSVQDNVLLGVLDGSSSTVVVSDAGTELLFGGTLAVAFSSGELLGAAAELEIADGALVRSNGVVGGGVLVVGGSDNDAGTVSVDGTGTDTDGNDFTAALDVQNATIGEGGSGTLFASGGGSVDVSGTLVLGDGTGGSGLLELAGNDGAGQVSATTLVVGNEGAGTVAFTSADSAYSGTLTVFGNAFVGASDGGAGTITADGGSFVVDNDLILGDGGSAAVTLVSTSLSVSGDLVIGAGGTAASLGLQDVTLALGGQLDVGEDGPGSLDWGSSADQSTTVGTVIIGGEDDGDGRFVLHDPTTFLTMGTLSVGDQGDGVLDVFNGASAEVTGIADIAGADGSSGEIALQAGTNASGAAYPNAGSSIVFDQDAYVGDGGDGSLLVGGDPTGSADSAEVDGDLIIGNQASASGYVEVANSSLLTVDGNIYVGNAATGGDDDLTGEFLPGGILGVFNVGSVDATATGAGLIDVGVAAGSTGSIEVDDAALGANTLVLGDGGDGELGIENGDVAVTGDIILGNSSDAIGTITIDGNSTLLAGGNLVIGGASTAIAGDGTIDYPAILNATNGALVEDDGTGDDGFIIGADANSLGEAIINGATLDVNAANIGDDGSGVLEIENASTATFNDDLLLGGGSAAFGGIDVNASDVDFYGVLDVGEDATGATVGGTFIPGAMLTVENDSTVFDQGTGGMDVGVGAGSTGSITIDNAEVDAAGVTVGDGGTGTLIIQDDGVLAAGQGAVLEAGALAGASGTIVVAAATLTVGGQIMLGDQGSGLLIVQNGGTVIPAGSQPPAVVLGAALGGTGTLLVDDSVFNAQSITVGANGAGTLYMQDSGTITAAAGMTLGAGAGSTGSVAAIGIGGNTNETLLQIGGSLTVGDSGAASLQVSNGATATVGGALDIGGTGSLLGDTGNGSVLVTDSGSVLQADSALVIGAGGAATVSVVSGGLLQAVTGLTLGQAGNAAGQLAISFASVLVNAGSVVVGAQGQGDVEVNGGADFNAGSSAVTLGSAVGANGTLGLGDALGSSTAETGALTVGAAGSGNVAVNAGSQLSTKGNAVIGNTGTGTVLVEGNNGGSPATASTWTITGNLAIGGTTTAGGGVGTLTVENGGAVHVGGAVTMWSQGAIIDDGTAPGLIEIGGTAASDALTGVVVDAAIAATGSTAATAAGTLVGGGTIAANILDNGLVEAANDQTLTVAGNVTGTGTLALSGTATLLLEGSVAAATTIAFRNTGTADEVLALADPLGVAGTITGLGAGDAIDLPGVAYAGTEFSVSGDVLTVTNDGGTVAALTLHGTYTTSQFSLAEDGLGKAEIVFGTTLPNISKPKLLMPVSLPGELGSVAPTLAGPLGIYVSDPNPPAFATYTITLTVQVGQLGGNGSLGSSQTFSGSLEQVNAALSKVYWSPPNNYSSPDANGDIAPPATFTVTLTRGDGTTVTGAIGWNSLADEPKAIYTGPTTVALGQWIPLSFVVTDPNFVENVSAFWELSTNGTGTGLSTNGTGILLAGYPETGGGYVGNGGTVVTGGGSISQIDAQLSADNLTYVPAAVGENTLVFSFEQSDNISAVLEVTIDVTPSTEIAPATDTWSGAASTALDAGGNWTLGRAPETDDTAVFAQIAGVPVIGTTGNGVADAWDIDASTSFAGIIDATGATGATGGPAVDIDQGATATFLDQSGLFANGALIVGDTSPGALIYQVEDDSGLLSNGDEPYGSLETDNTTIANQSGAGGSEMAVSAIDWADAGSIVVGGGAYGVLDLTDTDVNAADGVQIGAGGGVLGVVVSLYSSIDGDVLVGAGGYGELALGGGNSGSFFDPALVDGPGGVSDNGSSAVLAITNGSRVDLAAGNEIELGPNQWIYVDFGAVLSGDGEIGDTGGVILNGTIEAVDASAAGPLFIDANVFGPGTLVIDAGAILTLGSSYAAAGNIQAGTTVDFLPAYDAAGGTLSIADGDTMAATIIGFGADDSIALGASGVALESATFNAATDTTNVVFDMGSGGTTLTFAGSLAAGNFVLDPDQPAHSTVFDFTDPDPADQPLVLAGPTDIATTDGVATPIPGLSLSDAVADSENQVVTLIFTSQNGGIFSGVDSTGAVIAGSGSGTLTVSGALGAVQGDLAAIAFTPAAGTDDSITVTATDGSDVAPTALTIATHDSSADDADFAGTNNYIYAGPSVGNFDLAGSWQDETGSTYASAPGIADSATIEASPASGIEDVLGGFGLAGQLLTLGDVVLTGTLDLAGLTVAGIGTASESGPAFSGALDAGQGILIFGAGSELTAGSDVLVNGELDLLSDNDSTIAGNIVVSGGTMRLGGLGTVTAANVEIGSTINPAGAVTPGLLDIEAGLLLSTSGTIGTTTAGGTSVVDVGPADWTLDGLLEVGGSGDGLLMLNDRNTVSTVLEVAAPSVVIGASAGVTGTVLVNGSDTLVAGESLVIGAAGTGTLDNYGWLAVGSAALPGELDIGADTGGTGLMVSNAYSATVDGSVYVGGSSSGAGGAGTLDIISDGATVTVSGGVTVDRQGVVAMQDGNLSAGTVTVAPGGTVSGDGLIDGSAAGGAPVVPIVDDGFIAATVDPSNEQATLILYGPVTGTGTLAIAAGATLDLEGSVAASVHVDFLGSGAALALSDPADFAATIGGLVTGDAIHLPGIAPGTLSYTQATGVLTDTVASQVYSLTFDPPNGNFDALSDTHDGSLLAFTAPPGTLGSGEITLSSAAEDVALPPTTEVASFDDTSLEDPASLFSATIDWGDGTATDGTVTGGDGSFSVTGGHTYSEAGNLPLDVTIVDAGNGAELPVSGTVMVEAVPCFLPGTRIRTDRGEVPVEELQVGDTVVTFDRRSRRLCWIGHGRALATRGRRSAATPVIVRKGALADNVPHRDLRITKGHALYLDGVLIPVEFLVNHRSILWDDRAQEVTVFHLELDAHDVLVADGAPAESYRDDGNRWLFRNANSGWDQPPKPPCAPVLTGGRIVDAIWRRLLDRAGPRPGIPLTADADLHLVVDGARIDATVRHGAVHVFALPDRPASVRLVSRAGVPAELGLARDARLLGVAVRRIALRQGSRFCVMEAADPALATGFHAFEQGTGLRWTDGDAGVPEELFGGFDGPTELVLHVGGTTQYPLPGAQVRAWAA